MINFPEPICRLLRLEPGSITNIYGGPGTGKTNICLLLAVRCVKNGKDVFYMDTENGFSLERLKQVEPDNWQTCLEKIKLAQPKDLREQGDIIKSMEGNFGLIVIDSMVALYRLYYSERTHNDDLVMQANRELSKQLSILANIAREKKIPVIVTAHAYRSWETKEWDAIGGEILKYWSKAILFLERTGKTSERMATLMKHPYLPEHKNVKFEIVQTGIKPVGFKIF